MMSNRTHNEWFVARHLGEKLHLAAERAVLPNLLGDEEELLAVASADRGFFGKPGILAVSDQRLLYVSCGWRGKRCKIEEAPLSRVESLEIDKASSGSELRFRLESKRRSLRFVISNEGEQDVAAQIASCVSDATRRVRVSWTRA